MNDPGSKEELMQSKGRRREAPYYVKFILQITAAICQKQ